MKRIAPWPILDKRGKLTVGVNLTAVPTASTFTNNGTLSVAGTAGYGVNQLAGTFTQGSTGTLTVELRQVSGTAYDQLQISGAATLDGTLRVQGLAPLSVATGDEFTILTHAARSGTFSAYVIDPLDDRALEVRYAATTTKLVVTDEASRANDASRALLVPIGPVAVDLNLGAVRTEHGLDFDQSPGTAVGGHPALVYNSATVNVRPIVKVFVPTEAGLGLPTQLEARLTFDGATQSWVTYSTSGHAAGDTYVLASQVASAVAATGLYRWQVEVRITYTGATVDKVYVGSTPVLVRDDSPYGAGWGLAGIDRLYEVSSGVLWATGAGDWRFFLAAGSGTYTSPDGDFGTLVQNGPGTWTYTDKYQYQWHFGTTGLLETVVDALHNLTLLTYTHTSDRLTQVVALDGATTTLGYTSNLLSSISEPGSRTLTVAISAGNLTLLTDVDSTTRGFTYDGAHHLTRDQWAPFDATFGYDGTTELLTSLDRGLSSVYTIASAAAGGLQTSPALNSTEESKATLVDPLSNTTTYQLDAHGRPTYQKTPLHAEQTWQRDSQGQVTQYIDARTFTTDYQYDNSASGQGDLTEVNAPDGGTALYQYHTTHHR